MKKRRLGLPKFANWWSLLFAFGWLAFLVSPYVVPAAQDTVEYIGVLAMVAGLAVGLAGMIAERKEANREQAQSSRDSE